MIWTVNIRHNGSDGHNSGVNEGGITFIIALAFLLISFWYESIAFLALINVLFGFTLVYEIYRVRKQDLENKTKN